MTAPATEDVDRTGEDDDGLYWSHSATKKAGECALAWAGRNGPLRGTLGPKMMTDAQRRGLVVHDAIAAGLKAAVADPHPLPGVPLVRYWSVVRRAVGVAWDEHLMPSSRAEAERVMEMVQYACDTVTCPRAADVIAVEDVRDTTTPGGRPFRYVIDFAYWTGRPSARRIHITDWKTGADDVDKVTRNAQLARYGWFLAHDLDVDPRRVEVELHNVNRQRTRTVALDGALAAQAVARVDELAAVMERHAERGHFPGSPGPQCSSCYAAPQCPALAARQVPEAS